MSLRSSPPRGRARAWWLLLVVVLVAGVWALAGQLHLPAAWQAVAAVVAAVVPLVVQELRERFKQDDGRLAVCRTHLQLFPRRGARPPLVADVRDVTSLGVTPSRQGLLGNQGPYVARDADDALDALLRTEAFVLLIGDSKAGKSRMAAEAVRRVFPARRLLYPWSADSLVAVLAADVDLTDSVVWLDELQRYVDKDALSRLLDRVTGVEPPRGAIIVATVREQAYAEYQPQGALESPHWKALSRATTVQVDRLFSAAERERTGLLYRDPQLLAALGRYGLAEYLVAGPDLVRRLEGAMVGEQVGALLVRLMVDWLRTGLAPPVPVAVVDELVPVYAEALGIERPTRKQVREGIAWASRPIYARSSLVSSERGGFGVFDYVQEWLRSSIYSGSVPDAAWRAALRTAATVDEFVRIGTAAHDHQRMDIALEAFGRAVGTARDDDPAAAAAHYNHGVVLQALQRLPEAERAFTRAASLGHADGAFAAATLLLGRGAEAEAEVLLRQAADAGHADAAFTLGVLLREREPDEALRRLRFAADEGHPEAAYLAGRMLQARGDPAHEGHLRRAAQAGHVDGAFALGMLLHDRDPDEALVWLRRAAEAGQTDAALAAAKMLDSRGLAEAQRYYLLADPTRGASSLLPVRRRGTDVERWRPPRGNRDVRRSFGLARRTGELETTTRGWSADELRAAMDDLGSRHRAGESLDELLPEAFAVVREAVRRVHGVLLDQDHVMAAAALHAGRIAQVRAGRDTPLLTLLPACLRTLDGGQVHVVVGDDRAARSFTAAVGPVCQALGLTVAALTADEPAHALRAACRASVVTATLTMIAHTHLRDGTAWTAADLHHLAFDHAIVLRAEEAMLERPWTNTVIRDSAAPTGRWYQEFRRIVDRDLVAGVHYVVRPDGWGVDVSEAGVTAVEDYLGIDNLYDGVNAPLVAYLDDALRVHTMYRRGRDYDLVDERLVALDADTGQIEPERVFDDGIKQALEAKEGLQVSPDTRVRARISNWSLLRQYRCLSGLTTTTSSHADRFRLLYEIDAVRLSGTTRSRRTDHDDQVWRTQESRLAAVADLVCERHATGQPVLVDTLSDAGAEEVGRALDARGVPHVLLTTTCRRAGTGLLAEAGRVSAVTVVTNSYSVREPVPLGGAGAVGEERDRVVALGGLFVIGCGRRRTRSLDDLVRDHAGADGHPGETVFLLAPHETGLNWAALDWVGTRAGVDGPFSSRFNTWSIASLQAQLEESERTAVTTALGYAQVEDEQRRTCEDLHRRVLLDDVSAEWVPRWIEDVLAGYVEHAPDRAGGPDDERLWTAVRQLYPVSVPVPVGHRPPRRELVEAFCADARSAYARREAEIDDLVGSAGGMRELERQILLQVIDRKWREHLEELDELRQAVQLRAAAGRVPLGEYRRDAKVLFEAMLDGIKEETVMHLFNVRVQPASGPTAP